MSRPDPLATLNPSIVGQAEKAHNAILKRVLAGTTLDEHQWITLQLAAAASGPIGRGDLVARVTSTAKYDRADVEAAIAALISAALMESAAANTGALTITGDGRTVLATVRQKVSAFVGRAYGVIPQDDLATAARVLIAITAGLSEALAET